MPYAQTNPQGSGQHTMKNLFSNTVAELKPVYVNPVPASERRSIKNSFQAVEILRDCWEADMDICERFYVLLLNRANHVLGIKLVSMGGTSSCTVDPKIIFSSALISLASAVILAHNHPSGNTNPSENDKAITSKIVEGGKLLDIAVLDHIIITPDGFRSFSDQGLM